MKQLEARELRVGNYVSCTKKLLKKAFKKDYFEIIGIGELLGFVYLKIGDEKEIPIEIDKVAPIPLTEEWLEKAGCEKQSEDWYRLKITRRGVLEFYTPEGTMQVQVANKSGHSFGFAKIEYVHQLQNLYYALTGEELTIKEPTKE